GKSCIRQIPDDLIDHCVRSGQFTPTTHFERLSECDAILIAVPTPLTKNRDPDLTFVISTAETICGNLRSGQLIILESTTWPGTTDEVVKPILESAGLRSGQDFFLAFSPEREDPGNALFETSTIPKVVGGDGEDAMAAAQALYDCFVEQTVPVSSTSTAEAVKLTENIFRAVNIALVNELKIVYGRMGIDVWEVINAAKTKPFGFMPFYPGPGLGGHCIPIDPFYLTWKAREFDITTRFIELAGQINSSMPKYVVSRLSEALDQRAAKGINGARVLLIGMAYKKNVDDMRESPSLRFIEMLEDRGAAVDYHDPYIPVVPMTREHSQLAGRKSVDLTGASVAGYDVVLISTDHDGVDWELLSRNASLIVDSRNAMETAGLAGANVVKA
ncbi:MAG: nucleotide sugar dehydrogenase, partial [Pseudomonadota bacterium]